MRVISQNEIERLVEKIEHAPQLMSELDPNPADKDKTYMLALSHLERKTLIDALRFFAGAS